MKEQLKVAVVGLGNIGKVVATNFSKANRAFIAADRTLSKAKALALQLNNAATASSIDAAVKDADVVILAIPFGSIAGFLQQYNEELKNKIIIDPSNPIAPDDKGGFKKIIDADKSAGEINAAALPTGAKLVKTFGTLGAASLAGAAFKQPANVLFYATDDEDINADVEELIQHSGFTPLRVGNLDQSIRLEVFGDLHEFGALGKTVTLAEAKEKV